METKQIQIKKSEVITDVICDCCGKSCKIGEFKINNNIGDNEELYYAFEFMKMEAHWGYHSGKDTQKWTAQICEKCVDEKLSFINFKKEHYI